MPPPPRMPLGRPPNLDPQLPAGRAPGAGLGVVRRHVVEPPSVLELEEELEVAFMDCARGHSPGLTLGKGLERVAREILLRRGLGSAKVLVTSGPSGTSVRILLAPDGPVVGEIKLTMG